MKYVVNLQNPPGLTQSDLKLATPMLLGAVSPMAVKKATSTSQDLPPQGVGGMGHGTRRSLK